jgi:DNA primase
LKPVERIRNAVDVRKLLDEYGAQRVKGSGNIRSCCPIHGGDNASAFVFSESEKLWYCHTGCVRGGDVFDFVMELEECTFIESAKKLASMFNVTVDWVNETVEEDLFRDQAREFIERMMKKKKVHELPTFKPSGLKFAKIKSYRGYSPETIEWWKLRMCVEGELKDRIVIPLEDVDKRLVGITGRATLEEQEFKFMHRPRNLHTGYFLTGLGRNIEFVREAGNKAIIVEGLFDTAKLWDIGHKNVCCPIGVFFTDEHILQLYKAGVTDIVLAFDNDKAGRNGMRKAYKLARGKFGITFLDYPEGKDADDLEPEELDAVVKNYLMPHEWLSKYGEELENVKKN